MLTLSQFTTLKNDILADPVLSTFPHNSDGAFAVADLYALNAVPDFWVWRTDVTKEELTNSTSVDGTTFSWTGAGFIARSQGERDAWRELFNIKGMVNAALPQVRNAFLDIFSGATAPAPANRAHLATIARRMANRAEKLFATGAGSTASPATMSFEGRLSYQEVLTAMELP